MRVLIVTQIFLPEMGAQANRLYPIVRQLVAAGHKVFVATGMPNYPQGVVFPEYQGKRILREERDGFTIFRTACYTAPRNKSKWSQLQSYLSFIPAAFLAGLRAGKVDVVFVTSPPIFSAIPAIWLAKLRMAKLVFDIRDLWPDEIVTCGGARPESLTVRVISVIERQVYSAAACICCTTQSFIETIVERGVPREKTVLISNGADLELFRPLPPDNPVAAEYNFADRFVVMYSGVLGIKHGLEVILEAAHLLRKETRIVFFILGSGARQKALMERAEKMRLDNVIFGGERKVEEIPYLLARADVCLSALLPDPYLQKIITVKVFEYLACEKPAIAALAGETARVLRESGGGIVVPPDDSQKLADSILLLYHDAERRTTMGKSGRCYVEKNFSRAMSAKRLERVLRELCDGGQQKNDLIPNTLDERQDVSMTAPIRVLMITSEWPTAEQPHTTPFIKRQVDFLQAAGIDVEVFPFKGKKNPLNYLRAWRQLQQMVARRHYDLVHAQFGQSGLLALPKRIPLIVTLRGTDLLGVIGKKNGTHTRSGKILQWISRIVARHADAVIVVAEHMKRHLHSSVPVQVIPSGIDFGLFRCLPQAEARSRLGLPAHGRLVLFVGRPNQVGKRLEVARRAIEILNRSLCARLVVASSVDHADIPLYMNACDALVFTSMQEGSPNVIKEALACNLPIVSVPVGDVALRIKEIEGCELCAEDPESIARALERVLRRGQRVAGRETVKNLDERVITRQVIDLYESVLLTKRRPDLTPSTVDTNISNPCRSHLNHVLER